MSEKVYDVPAEWAKRAFIDDAKYRSDVRALDRRSGRLLGRAGQAHRLDQAVHQGQEHLLRLRTTSRSNGSRTASSTSPPTASTAISPSAATRSRSSGKATIPRTTRKITYRELHARGLPLRQRAQGARRQEGRPRHHLPADDPGGGRRDARLRAHRRGALGGVRRLLAGFARRPHRGLRIGASSSPPTKAVRGGRKIPLKANVDDGAADTRRGVDHGHRRARAPAPPST